MSWKPLKEFAGSLGFRLNLLYACIFCGSAALLFVLIYYLLGAAIDHKDRNVIQARLQEYSGVYQRGGLAALQSWVRHVDDARRQRTFFVRVAHPNRHVRFLEVPDDWTQRDVARLDYRGWYRLDPWLRVPRDSEIDLTVASTFLPDGTFIQVGRSSESRAKLLGNFREMFAIVIPPVLALGFLGGALLSRRMTRPLGHLAETVTAIVNTGKMSVRVPTHPANDELSDLVALFNRMLDGNEALIRALSESIDNVAHDLRTPLARLRARVEHALKHGSDAESCRGTLADALEETERVQTIIRTIMDVTRAEAGVLTLDFQPVDLTALVDDTIDLYADVAGDKRIAITKDFGALVSVRADAGRLRQVFANLLDNALKFTPPGGSIVIAADREPERVVVRFRDSGIGIDRAELPRIWDRLYRVEKSRALEGLGLGLSLVKAIVQAHGGSVEASSDLGAGAEFRVILPPG